MRKIDSLGSRLWEYQRAAHEGVGGGTVSELEIRGLVAIEEGA